MKNFIIKRILSVIPVLVIVSVVIFSVVHLTPGDPAASILGADDFPGTVLHHHCALSGDPAWDPGFQK